MSKIDDKISINLVFKVLTLLPTHNYCTAAVLYETIGCSKGSIGNTMAKLIEDGFVISLRGREGGYRLRRKLETIKMKELIPYAQKSQHFMLCKTLAKLGDMSFAEFIKE